MDEHANHTQKGLLAALARNLTQDLYAVTMLPLQLYAQNPNPQYCGCLSFIQTDLFPSHASVSLIMAI